MNLFENVPDYINDIYLGFVCFLLPFYSISLLLYYCFFETFKQKSFIVKVLLIILGIAFLLPIIKFAIEDFTWAFISFLITPFICLINYPAVFSLLMPVPLLIAAKADKKKIAPIWWVLYATIVVVSTLIMIIRR